MGLVLEKITACEKSVSSRASSPGKCRSLTPREPHQPLWDDGRSFHLPSSKATKANQTKTWSSDTKYTCKFHEVIYA